MKETTSSKSNPLFIVLWILAILVAPFVFLPVSWAILSIIYLSVISPILTVLLYSPLKKITDKYDPSHSCAGYLDGAFEALVLFLAISTFSKFVHIPDGLLSINAFMYLVNQYGRINREVGELKNWEAESMIGFFVSFILWQFIFTVPF